MKGGPVTTDRTPGAASLTLPANPHPDHLRKQARQLLRSHRAKDATTLAIVATFHPRPEEFSSLRDAQLTVARRHGFADWAQLSAEVELRQFRSSSAPQQVERFIDHACLRYNGDDQAWRYQRATTWLQQMPALTRDFHAALVAADVDSLRSFLPRDAGLATRLGGPRNWPPLMYITYSRIEQNAAHAVAAARLLIEHGADPDAQAPSLPGFNAVTGAIGEGERGPVSCVPHPCADELVALFLDAGASPNQSQALYNTMLGHTLGKWLQLFVQRGLKAGEPANWNPGVTEPIFDFLLSNVASQGRIEVVRLLLEHGANPDAISRYNHRSAHTNAQLAGQAGIAALLEQHGATARPLTIEDQFRVACAGHDRTRANHLLQEHRQLLRDGALFRECAMVDVDTCLWLVAQGFDINTRDDKGQTVLHNYALWNNPDAVRALLQHGADPDLQDRLYGATPLGFALHHHHWSVVEVLAPISNDVFDVCRTADSQRLQILLERDPSLAKLRTPMGNTPLHVVSQARQDDPDVDGSMATIDLLLKHGADPGARNNEARTPAEWYRQHGMDELADYLASRRVDSDQR
jgi:ankyrin repeat protein